MPERNPKQYGGYTRESIDKKHSWDVLHMESLPAIIVTTGPEKLWAYTFYLQVSIKFHKSIHFTVLFIFDFFFNGTIYECHITAYIVGGREC